MTTTTTTIMPCLLSEWNSLHPCVRRVLRLILNLPEASGRDPGRALSDLCLCQREDVSEADEALRFADDRCGARIPLVVIPGPPAMVLCQIRDLGAVATWYFRALELLHGGDCPRFEEQGG